MSTPMSTCGSDLWKRYCERHLADPGLGFALDMSRVDFDDAYLGGMASAIEKDRRPQLYAWAPAIGFPNLV